MSDNPVKRFFADFLLGAAGRVSKSEAEKLGRPEVTGLSRDELGNFLRMQQEQRLQDREDMRAPLEREKLKQDIATGRANEQKSLASAKAREHSMAQIKSADPKSLVQVRAQLERSLTGMNALLLPPEELSYRKEQLQAIDARLGTAAPSAEKPAPGGNRPAPAANPKATAQVRTGWIAEGQFDPKLYVKLGQKRADGKISVRLK